MDEFFDVKPVGYTWRTTKTRDVDLDSIQGCICEMYFAGKKFGEAHEKEIDWAFENIESGRSSNGELHEEVEYYLSNLNDVLYLITDEDNNESTENKLEELHLFLGRNGTGTLAYKTWEDYFQCLGEVEDHVSMVFKIRGDLLPDFNALKQGKFIYEGKLMAEI